MQSMKLKLTGNGPILMHSDRMANPLDPIKKKMAAISGKRKKTAEDHEQLAHIEWEAGMYHDADIGPYLPGKILKAGLIAGAKKTRSGPKVKSGVLVLTDKAPLEYEGPRDLVKMWAAGSFADIRSVVVQRARLMRCRPIFHNWSATFELMFDDTVVDREDILAFAETCGQMIGIGDYRPESGGDFGRFYVEEVK